MSESDQPTHHGYAVNVKDHGHYAPNLADEIGEAAVERAYETAREQFWTDAEEIAREHGFREVYSEGRMGGWCVPMPQPSEDSVGPRLEYVGDGLEEWERDRFRPFEAAILEALQGARDYFSDLLTEEREELEARRDINAVRGES